MHRRSISGCAVASVEFFFVCGKREENKNITAGNGHGMGLSCWTQINGKRRKTYKEILEFFYEGTKTEKDLNFIAKINKVIIINNRVREKLF